MMQLFIIALATLLPTAAQAAKPTVESEAIIAVMASCFEPLKNGDDPAIIARQDSLPELPAAQAEVLAQKGGSAFVIRPGSTVLAVSAERECAVYTNKVDYDRFKNEIEIAFPEDSAFKIESQKAEGDTVIRTYSTSDGEKRFYLVVQLRKRYE